MVVCSYGVGTGAGSSASGAESVSDSDTYCEFSDELLDVNPRTWSNEEKLVMSDE